MVQHTVAGTRHRELADKSHVVNFNNHREDGLTLHHLNAAEHLWFRRGINFCHVSSVKTSSRGASSARGTTFGRSKNFRRELVLERNHERSLADDFP